MQHDELTGMICDIDPEQASKRLRMLGCDTLDKIVDFVGVSGQCNALWTVIATDRYARTQKWQYNGHSKSNSRHRTRSGGVQELCDIPAVVRHSDCIRCRDSTTGKGSSNLSRRVSDHGRQFDTPFGEELDECDLDSRTARLRELGFHELRRVLLC